jgi:hypothetical protein
VGLLGFADHHGALDESTVWAGRAVCDPPQFEAFLKELCGILGRRESGFRDFFNGGDIGVR